MKNLTKLFSGIFLGFVLSMTLSTKSHAAIPRSPKEVFVSSATTGAIGITPAISTNAVTAAQVMPGAVYEVLLSTGASSEYVLLVDSSNCTGITAPMLQSSLTAPANFLSARLFFGSTTANTDIKFDPPLVFENGLCAVDSAVTGTYAITYELGRGLSGN